MSKAKRQPTELEVKLLDKMLGVDAKATSAALAEMYDRIGSMESDNKLDAANKESSAKGVYQYLNENGNEKEGTLSSFQVALNRASKAYQVANLEQPKWIKEAKKHNDPRKLSRKQSDELFLSDVLLRKERTIPLVKDFLVRKDYTALADLYANVHHTDVNQNENVLPRMKERLGALPSNIQTQSDMPFADTPTDAVPQDELQAAIQSVMPNSINQISPASPYANATPNRYSF
jgi:hypothetical protein